MDEFLIVLNVGLVLVAAALGYQWGREQGGRAGKKLAESAEQNYITLAEATRDSYQEAIQHERDASRRLSAELAAAERQHAHCGESIKAFSDQRTQWQKLYQDQSLAHGNAQTMMMETIGRLSKKLTDAGIDPRVPSVLRQVQEDFTGTHVAPALAALKADSPTVTTNPYQTPTGERGPESIPSAKIDPAPPQETESNNVPG